MGKEQRRVEALVRQTDRHAEFKEYDESTVEAKVGVGQFLIYFRLL